LQYLALAGGEVLRVGRRHAVDRLRDQRPIAVVAVRLGRSRPCQCRQAVQRVIAVVAGPAVCEVARRVVEVRAGPPRRRGRDDLIGRVIRDLLLCDAIDRLQRAVARRVVGPTRNLVGRVAPSAPRFPAHLANPLAA